LTADQISLILDLRITYRNYWSLTGTKGSGSLLKNTV